jgi:hypothetical protein
MKKVMAKDSSKAENTLHKEAIIDFLKKNKKYLKNELGITKIALFGSYARDEQTINSDIDLLIEVKVHDFRNRMQLKHFLEKEFQKSVDVGYFSALRIFVKKSIQQDLIYA